MEKEDFYELSNEVIKIKVDSVDAELKAHCRLSDRKEYIWNLDQAYWKRMSPVLFPLAGSLQGQQYTHEGKTYAMSQHGLGRDMEFNLIKNDSEQKYELLD